MFGLSAREVCTVGVGVREVATCIGLALTALLSLAGPTQALATDWPSYRGGLTQNMSRAEDPGTGPQQIWEGISSARSERCVIAVGGSLFTFATPSTDFGAQRLFRIDASTGKVIWSSGTFSTDVSSSCPAADDSRVYFAKGNHLTALDISDGKEAWSADLGGEVGMPVVSGGTVYVNAEGKESMLFARAAGDGSKIWSAPAPAARRAPLVVSGAVVSITSSGSSSAFSAYSPEDGASLWATGTPVDEIIGVNGAVVYSTGESIVARNASAGSVLWTYPAPPLTSPRKLVADSSNVYVLTPSTNHQFQVNHLIALDLETGEVVYSREFDKVESCCGTTAAYPPFVKFGQTLYNHYRYFDAATGEAPGGPFGSTQTVFYDGKSCSNEQDSMFAHVGLTVYAWKDNCSSKALVARRDAVPPQSFDLVQPVFGSSVATTRPSLVWKENGDNPGGTGVDHYEVILDGKTLAEGIPFGAGSFTPAFDLSPGAHSWSVTAVDKAGNSRPAEESTFTIDATPPEAFDLLAPADEAVVGPRPQLTWEPASDLDSGIDQYLVTVDGEVLGKALLGEEAFTIPFDLTSGAHTWSVTALDNAGNSRDSESRTFTVDDLPPDAFELIAPVPDAVTNTKPQFSWQATKDLGGAVLDHYELIVNGKVLQEVPAGTEFAEPEVAELGEKLTWAVAAVDSVGNRYETKSQIFTIDGSSPKSVILIAPVSGEATNARPQFSWNPRNDLGPAGLDRYELILDKEVFAKIPASTEPVISFTPDSDLAEGPHVWQVKAVDRVGNFSTSQSRTFSVDSAPPTAFGLLEPSNGALVSARPQFGWEPSSDEATGLSHYELIVDGETLVPKVPPEEQSFLPEEDLSEGPHTWSVKAIDNLGNERDSETRTFTVDASPPDPFKLIEPSDGAVTGALPQFAWEAASDSGEAGIGVYELIVDGEVLAKRMPGEESFAPESELIPGGHTWQVTAVDKVGNARSSESHSFIVASPPIAVLAEPSVLTLTGTPVTFDASASVPPAAGTITNYEWDLNGDGTFERDTGEVPMTTRTYNNVKDLTMNLRVKSNLGTEATTSAQVSIRLAPPPGHLGVTINEGAEFTNSRKVTISPVWPVFALTALVSNDGGFGAASTFPVATSIQWKLDSSGAERLPKTIYVRFQDGESGRETYQDDIILDLVKPKLLAASLSKDGDMLRVQARDSISGLAAMQISNSRTESKGWRRFRRQVEWVKRRRAFVRVRDRAGNVSKWTRVAGF